MGMYGMKIKFQGLQSNPVWKDINGDLPSFFPRQAIKYRAYKLYLIQFITRILEIFTLENLCFQWVCMGKKMKVSSSSI